MKKKRSFTNFLKEEGYIGIRKLAKNYAYGPVTYDDLSKDYNVTTSCIRKALAEAIKDPFLITDDDANSIASKSAYNQTPHSKTRITKTTSLYYERLMEEREKNKIEGLSEEEIEQLKLERDSIKSQLDNYDDWVSSDQERELSKKDLEKRLRDLEDILKNYEE